MLYYHLWIVMSLFGLRTVYIASQ